MKTVFITPSESVRLDRLLQKELPLKLGIEISNAKIRRLIIAGCVTADSLTVRRPPFLVRKNARVAVFVDEEKLLFEKPADDISFEVSDDSVLYEDEYFIFVNKPAKFPTEKTVVQSRDNLHDAVVRYLWRKNPSLRNPPYAGIMHRLDRETSGVILFTKERSVNKAVFDLFDSSKLNLNEGASRPLVKSYVALVPDSEKIKERFTVRNSIGRISSKSARGKWGVVPAGEGLEAVTEFSVLSRENRLCRLLCHPVTGRTHQIRVHLASLGCAIEGDVLYGAEEKDRLYLHSYSIEFVHPVTNEKICVTAPVPF